jgi:hypothetical protein
MIRGVLGACEKKLMAMRPANSLLRLIRRVGEGGVAFFAWKTSVAGAGVNGAMGDGADLAKGIDSAASK